MKNWPIITVLLFSTHTMAERSSDHGHRHDEVHESVEQESHAHGVAELMVAIEDDLIEIRFESPAANIVGFEHKASSQEQIKAVEDAKTILETPTKLFSFVGGNCLIKQVKTDVSKVSHDDHAKPDKDKHSEIIAEYLYSCQSFAEFETISIDLIDLFPAIEKINAVWITETQQSSAKLTANNKTIRIR